MDSMDKVANRLPEMLATTRWSIAVLWSIVLAAFGKSLTNAYAYDGLMLIDRMRAFAGTPSVVFDADAYGTATGIMSWRPLGALATMIVDIRLFGESPPLSHGLNLVLHATTASLLLLLARRIAGKHASVPERLACLAGACVFAVHPLVSEVVLCAGFRYDMFATVSLAGMLLALTRAADRPAPSIAAGLALFAVALLGKETAAAGLLLGPLAMAATGCGPRQIAVFAAGAACVLAAWLALWMQYRFADYPSEFLGGGGRLLGIANFLVAGVEVYLRLFAAPWPLRIDHGFVPVDSLFAGRVAFAVAVVAAALAGAAILARRHSLCLLGGLWIAATFAPVSQIAPVPDPVAERFCYAPMAGAALLAAGALSLLARADRNRPALSRLAVATILAWTALSAVRAWDWRDNIALNLARWRGIETAEALESRSALLAMRAEQLLRAGDAEASRASIALAEDELSRLLEQDPSSAEANRLMAALCLATGRADDAQRFAAEAVRLAPDDPLVQALVRALEAYRAAPSAQPR